MSAVLGLCYTYTTLPDIKLCSGYLLHEKLIQNLIAKYSNHLSHLSVFVGQEFPNGKVVLFYLSIFQEVALGWWLEVVT